MNAAAPAFRAASATEWTRERLDQLDRQELLNLQANALRLGKTALAALCGRGLTDRPQRGPTSSGAVPRMKGRDNLVPRSTAFGARRVYLQNPRTSWSGIRKADGMVVMAVWYGAVQMIDGGCACLLWSPNTGGARSWSDTAAGQERREHCKVAMERGTAEGLLVHGEALEGRLPEDRARTVFGIDAATVVHLQVERRGVQYWATWGKKKEAPSAALRRLAPPSSAKRIL
jgi:hypothetical protein